MLNKSKIMSQIVKAIKIMPTPIILKRVILVPDGMNGYINEGYPPTTIATFDGLINDSQMSRSSGNDETLSDAGNKETLTNITLMCPSEDKNGKPFTILHGDFFTANNTLYKVVQPNLVYGIYWMCELEVDC